MRTPSSAYRSSSAGAGMSVVAEQHRPVQRRRHDQPVELGAASAGSSSCEQAAGGQALESRRPGPRSCARGRARRRRARARESGRPRRSRAAAAASAAAASPAPAAAGQVAQLGLEVAAVLSSRHLVVDRVAGLVDRAGDDLGEQALLVGEVLVDGLLRDARRARRSRPCSCRGSRCAGRRRWPPRGSPGACEPIGLLVVGRSATGRQRVHDEDSTGPSSSKY